MQICKYDKYDKSNNSFFFISFNLLCFFYLCSLIHFQKKFILFPLPLDRNTVCEPT